MSRSLLNTQAGMVGTHVWKTLVHAALYVAVVVVASQHAARLTLGSQADVPAYARITVVRVDEDEVHTLIGKGGCRVGAVTLDNLH